MLIHLFNHFFDITGTFLACFFNSCIASCSILILFFHMETPEQPTSFEQNRQTIANFFIIFVLVIATMTNSHWIINYPCCMLAINSSMWLPQIIHNQKKNSYGAPSLIYAIVQSLFTLYMPYALSEWMPHFQPAIKVAGVWMIIQVIILKIQRRRPRFLV